MTMLSPARESPQKPQLSLEAKSPVMSQVSDNPMCTTAQGLASVEARLRSELPLFCWLNGACVPIVPPEPAQVTSCLIAADVLLRMSW